MLVCKVCTASSISAYLQAVHMRMLVFLRILAVDQWDCSTCQNASKHGAFERCHNGTSTALSLSSPAAGCIGNTLSLAG